MEKLIQTAYQPTMSSYAQFQLAFEFFNEKLFDNKILPCIMTFESHGKSYGHFSKSRFVDGNGNRIDKICLNSAYFAITPLQDTLSTLVHEMAHGYIAHHGSTGRRGYHTKEWGELMESIGLMPTDTGLPGGKKTGEKVTHYIIEGGKFDLVTKNLRSEFDGINWYDRYVTASPESMKRLFDQLKGFGVVGELSTIPAFQFGPSLGLCIPGKEIPEDLAIKKKTTQKENNYKNYEGTNEYKKSKTQIVNLEISNPEIYKENRSNRVTYLCGSCDLKVWGKHGLYIKCGKCDQILGSDE